MTQGSPPKTINLKIINSGSVPFKSIKPQMEWNNIPLFAVLTGRNGSGKSQLLDLLAHKLTNTTHPQLQSALQTTKVDVEGDTFGADDIVYIPNSHNLAHSVSLDLGSMQSVKQNLYSQLREDRNLQGNMHMRSQRKRIEKILGIDNLTSISNEEFQKRVPDDFAFMLEDYDVVRGLAHVFLGYRLQRVERLDRKETEEKILKELGTPPWDILNDTLAVADFPYRVDPPKGSLLDRYELFLRDTGTGTAIYPGDLSSGEKVLLQLVLWLFNSKNFGRYPRLFLLDEPDAHLHPSMTRQFMSVIREVLVEKFGVRVIMSTHSPSTVALAPDNSVFEMSRGAQSISPSPSKAHAIGLLTAGLIVVSPTTRFVLVEDEFDVQFYGALFGVLSDFGPSKDPMALAPAPAIAFLPASLGAGKTKIGGGKGPVQKWVEKLDAEPFDQLVRGIIDGDDGNQETDRVKVLGRYNIENYLLDPFVVFGLLVELGQSSAVPGVMIAIGDEHQIKALPPQSLQSIVDLVRSKIEPHLQGLTVAEKSTISVEFTTGLKLDYPSWLITRNGHDLLPVFQSVFGNPQSITPPRLLKALQRVRLVPKELALLLHSLQS